MTPRHRDFHHHFKINRFRAFFSKKYVWNFYLSELLYSPTLLKLSNSQVAKIIHNELHEARVARKIIARVLSLYALYVLIIAFVEASSPRGPIMTVCGGLLVVAYEAYLLRKARHANHETAAASRLFFAVLYIDSNMSAWKYSQFRWGLATQLERIAGEIERIPFVLRRIAPTVRKECFRLAKCKAQAIRDIEVSVINPKASTYDEVYAQLARDLLLVIDDRWFDLPESDYQYQISRLRFIMQIVGACLAFTAAIAVIIFTSKFGPAGPVLTTVLLAVCVGLLNISGLSTEIVGRYIKTGSEVTPKS